MRDKIEKVLDNNIDYYGTSKEDLLNELCVLFGVSNCANKIERPSPYKWIKEEKFKIPDGTSYREPKVNLIQCANWISEYVKKHCC